MLTLKPPPPNLDNIQEEILHFLKKSHLLKTPYDSTSSLKDDLCMDSLDIVELMVYLEEKFKIDFESKELPSLNSIDDLTKHTHLLLLK